MNEPWNLPPPRPPQYGHRRYPPVPANAPRGPQPLGADPSRPQNSSPRSNNSQNSSPRSKVPSPSFWVHDGEQVDTVQAPRRPAISSRHGPRTPQPNSRYDLRPGSLAGGPGPEFSPPTPRHVQQYRPPSNADPRLSQYSASLYSNVSPNTSPESKQKPVFDSTPTFSIPHSNLRPSFDRAPPSNQGRQRNPFVEPIVEVSEPSSSSKISKASSTSSAAALDAREAADTDVMGQDKTITDRLHFDRPSLVREASLGKRHGSPRLTTINRSSSGASKNDKRDDASPAIGGLESNPTMPPFNPYSLKPASRNKGPSDPAITSTSASTTSRPDLPRIDTSGASMPKSAEPKDSLVPAPLRSPARAQGTSRPTSPPQTQQRLAVPGVYDSHQPPISPASAPTIPRSKSPFLPPESRFSRATAPGPGGKVFLLPQREKSLKERVGNRKPSNINVGAVKEAEARGSITSLPGLINRALTLASNIETGRTSSKNSDWFGNDLLRQLAKRGKSTASLGHVLEGFTFSPTVHDEERKRELQRGVLFNQKFEETRKGRSMLKQMDLAPTPEPSSHRGEPPVQRRRRCCGMPLWVFSLLIIVIIILVALAVILPVVLVVVPRQNHQQSVSGECSSTKPCQNGGSSVQDSAGKCQCICVDNFSGSNCQMAQASGCGTIQTQWVLEATVGQDLVNLIQSAQGSYKIPLNATEIVPLLTSNDLSCSSQNALVSLNGKSSKRAAEVLEDLSNGSPLPSQITPQSAASVTLTGSDLMPRQGEIATSAGLQIAGPASQTSTASAQSSSSPASSGKGSDSGNFDENSPRTLNLAQTAILYTLQTSQSLNAAVLANSMLQSFLNKKGANTDPSHVDLGNGWSVDLKSEVVSGNGHTVGEGTDGGG